MHITNLGGSALLSTISGRIRLTVALLACLGAPLALSHAQETTASDPVKQLRRGTPHDALYDVAFDGGRGLAVGAFGTVMASADGGATWERQATPTGDVSLLSVAVRGDRCMAVGQGGLVLTADDCRSWRTAPGITKSRLLAVDVNRHGIAYAVGAFGTILRSDDWGKSWAAQTVDWTAFTQDGAEPHLYDVHVADDGTATVVGEFELVLRSGIGGLLWKALHKGERSLFGLSVGEDGQLLAVGQSGALIASGDNGTSWRTVSTGTGAILTSVHVTRGETVLASGINTLVMSRDKGATWTSVPSRWVGNAWVQAIATGDAAGGSHRVVAVGSGGSILQLDL